MDREKQGSDGKVSCDRGRQVSNLGGSGMCDRTVMISTYINNLVASHRDPFCIATHVVVPPFNKNTCWIQIQKNICVQQPPQHSGPWLPLPINTSGTR